MTDDEVNGIVWSLAISVVVGLMTNAGAGAVVFFMLMAMAK